MWGRAVCEVWWVLCVLGVVCNTAQGGSSNDLSRPRGGQKAPTSRPRGGQKTICPAPWCGQVGPQGAEGRDKSFQDQFLTIFGPILGGPGEPGEAVRTICPGTNR